MRIRSVVAMVPVSDMTRSLAFYQRLGFDVENDFVPAGQQVASWAWLDGGGGMLMLRGEAGAATSSGPRAVYHVYCSDVAEAHAELQQKGVVTGPLEIRFYAPKGEFRVEDPDGHVLMFTHM